MTKICLPDGSVGTFVEHRFVLHLARLSDNKTKRRKRPNACKNGLFLVLKVPITAHRSIFVALDYHAVRLFRCMCSLVSRESKRWLTERARSLFSAKRCGRSAPQCERFFFTTRMLRLNDAMRAVFFLGENQNQMPTRHPRFGNLRCFLAATGVVLVVASCISVSVHNEQASQVVVPPIDGAHNLTRTDCRMVQVSLEIRDQCPFPGGQPYACASVWATVSPLSSAASLPRLIVDLVEPHAPPVNITGWSAGQLDVYRHQLHAQYPPGRVHDCACWYRTDSPDGPTHPDVASSKTRADGLTMGRVEELPMDRPLPRLTLEKPSMGQPFLFRTARQAPFRLTLLDTRTIAWHFLFLQPSRSVQSLVDQPMLWIGLCLVLGSILGYAWTRLPSCSRAAPSLDDQYSSLQSEYLAPEADLETDRSHSPN